MEFYYRWVLNVSENSSIEEINKAYKQKIIQVHPDKGGNEEQCKLLNEAKRFLFEDLQMEMSLKNVYRETYERAITEFTSIEFENNFKHVFLELLTNSITTLNSQLSDSTYHCQICEKTFSNPQHHFHTIIKPYIDTVIGDNCNYETNVHGIYNYIKEFGAFGDPWECTQKEEEYGFWTTESSWNEIPGILQHIKKFTSELNINNIDFTFCRKPFELPKLEYVSNSELHRKFNLIRKHPSDWTLANVANKCCQNEEYAYALAALQAINVETNQANKELWRLLGNSMSSFHSQLAIFCYIKCNFKPNEWLSQAKFYSRRIKELKMQNRVDHQLAFLCIQKELNLENSKKFDIINQLLEEKEYQLAVYSLKTAELTQREIIEILDNYYLGSKDIIPVIILIKYILSTFSVEEIENVRHQNVLFCTIIQMQSFPDLKIQDLLSAMNIATNVQDLIPLIGHLNGLQKFESWKVHGKQSLQMKLYRAAIICMKLEELTNKNFDQCRWRELGLTLLLDKDTNTSIVCFLLSDKTGGQFSSIVNELISIQEYQAIIKLCVYKGKLTVLRKIGNKFKNESELETAFLFYWAYIVELKKKKGDSTVHIMETLMMLIGEGFSGQNSKEFIKIQIQVLKCYNQVFFQSVAFPFHYSFINQILSTEKENFKGYEMLLAGLHFLPETDQINKQVYKNLLSAYMRKELATAYNQLDFKRLEKILPQISKLSLDTVSKFLNDEIGTQDILSFKGHQKTFFLLLKGTVNKVKGDLLESLRSFEYAVDTCSTALFPEVIACISSIFAKDPQFQVDILHLLLEELEQLKMNFHFNFGNIQPVSLFTILLPECDPKLTNSYDESHKAFDNPAISCAIQEMQKCLQNKTELDAGFICLKASESFSDLSPVLEIYTLLMSCCFFLKAMTKEENPATTFAMRNLIVENVNSIFNAINTTGFPHLAMGVMRVSFSLLFKSNQIFSTKLPINVSRVVSASEKKPVELIAYDQRKVLQKIMADILHFAKVYPFVGTPTYSLEDSFYMNDRRISLLGSIYELKCKQDIHWSNISRYLFSAQKFDFIFNGWLQESSSCEEAAKQVVQDFFEWRQWATEDVQQLFELYLERWNGLIEEKECSKKQVKLTRVGNNILTSIFYISKFATTRGLKYLVEHLWKEFLRRLEILQS